MSTLFAMSLYTYWAYGGCKSNSFYSRGVDQSSLYAYCKTLFNWTRNIMAVIKVNIIYANINISYSFAAVTLHLRFYGGSVITFWSSFEPRRHLDILRHVLASIAINRWRSRSFVQIISIWICLLIDCHSTQTYDPDLLWITGVSQSRKVRVGRAFANEIRISSA